jgi:hypothetical protein
LSGRFSKHRGRRGAVGATEALCRFDVDSGLTPLNYKLSLDARYAEYYARLVEAI